MTILKMSTMILNMYLNPSQRNVMYSRRIFLVENGKKLVVIGSNRMILDYTAVWKIIYRNLPRIH